MRTHSDGVLKSYDEKRMELVPCVFCDRQMTEPYFCQRAACCLMDRRERMTGGWNRPGRSDVTLGEAMRSLLRLL